MTLHLDLFQSAGVGVCALLLGMLFTRNIPFLKRFCIPAPVSGGLLVSLITLLLYSLGVECTFDGSVKDLCMMLFFTSVGFQSDMKALCIVDAYRDVDYVETVRGLVPESLTQERGHLHTDEYPFLEHLIYMGPEKHRGFYSVPELLLGGSAGGRPAGE